MNEHQFENRIFVFAFLFPPFANNKLFAARATLYVFLDDIFQAEFSSLKIYELRIV